MTGLKVVVARNFISITIGVVGIQVLRQSAVVATSPRDRHTPLLVSVRNLEVGAWNPHLTEDGAGLSRAHSNLFHEVEEGRYQIFIEVKVVMVHSCGHQEAARTATGVVELFGMLAVYQGVLHSVDQESGAFDVSDLVDVLEPVLNEILKNRTSLVLSHSSYTLESRHQEHGTRVPLASDMSGRSTAHAAAEDDDVLFGYSEHLVYVVVDVNSIVEDVLFVGFEDLVVPLLVHEVTLMLIVRALTYLLALTVTVVTILIGRHRSFKLRPEALF